MVPATFHSKDTDEKPKRAKPRPSVKSFTGFYEEVEWAKGRARFEYETRIEKIIDLEARAFLAKTPEEYQALTEELWEV